MKTPRLHLSPSEYHRWLSRQISPALRYQGGPVVTWQRKLRRKLTGLLGEKPIEKVPLRTRVLWKRDHSLGEIEKIVFTSEPFSDVLAYVCLPAAAKPPYRFVICLQGHSSGMHNSIAVTRENETVPLAVEGDRDFAIECMRQGFAALCLEQRSFGDRREQRQERISPHGCHDAVMHALLLGKTLLGERVWDVERALDYLESRSDVDQKSIGIMGNSGGGTVAIYAAALLPRIAYAMPSCAFCTFRDSILSIYHCADNYIPGLFRYAEMADVLGLFAPKPVVIVAGRKDAIFPITNVREAFRDLRKIYATLGADDQCKLIVGPDGHRFYAEAGWRALRNLIG